MVFKQVQPIRRPRSDAPLSDLPANALDPARVAVLLNRNARRVSDRLARQMERIVGRENLYFSRSLEEAEAYCREIVQRGYGTVVCGGGDGTLVRAFNLVQRYVDESNGWRLERYRRFGEVQSRLCTPRFAFLNLGTGNGLRNVVGANSPLRDLRTIAEDVPSNTRCVPMISGQGERFTFGGMGYDSLLLNDYNWLRQRVHSRIARPVVQTVAGYFAALLTRTLPRALKERDMLRARLVSKSDSYYVDPRRGDAAVLMPAGSVLHDGPVTMVGMGTTPFFGYGFKIFPFASMMPGMMHLRVTNNGPLATLANLPAAWRGTYRSRDTIFDFLVKDVSIELDRSFPFQHSGDDQGPVSNLQLAIADETLTLVDLYK